MIKPISSYNFLPPESPKNAQQLASLVSAKAKKDIKFSSEFESGSIGNIQKISDKPFAYELSLRDDNHNSSLPESWRTWFYVRIDNISPKNPLCLKFNRLGFPDYFIPVYSYDNKNWKRFSESEVQMSSDCSSDKLSQCRLTINKQFKRSPVWIARTFPYTTRDLKKFMSSIQSNLFVKTSVLGNTSEGRPIHKITISDDQEKGPKQAIFINARTHPAETGSSFLLEEIIKTILANDAIGKELRKKYVFHIVPMQNVDGVVRGNYRTNSKSQNLENQWRFNKEALPSPLNKDVPIENQVVGNLIWQLHQDKNEPLVLALNLHSSNSQPNDPAFFYPHFGSDPKKYTPEQQKLWEKQIDFIKRVDGHYSGPIQPPPTEGGSGFLNAYYPETWHWYNNGAQINAITLETVYGRAGLDRWVTPEDYRKLGKAVAQAILNGGDNIQLPSIQPKSSVLASLVYKSNTARYHAIAI